MLDIKPTDEVDGDEIFSSLATVNKAVLGVYADWEPSYTLRIGSVMADECRIGLKNAGVNGAAQNLFRWSYASGDNEISAPWVNAYQVINRANRILEGIDKVPATDEGAMAEKEHLKGELLAIRAFEHFELYRTYGSAGVYNGSAWAVPYVTSSSVDEKPARHTYADFFALLEKDIAAALSLIDSNTDVTRMHLYAVYALEARVALYMGNWAEAAEYAGKVIDNIPLAEMSEFPAVWTDQSNAEVIFKLKRTNSNSIRPGDIWKNLSLGIIYFAPSAKLLTAYDSERDVRYHSYFGNDPSLATDGQLTDIITKYAGTAGAENLNDIKVFRTAEMYLIQAESFMNIGQLTAGTADLNTLCSKRIQHYVPQLYGSAKQLQQAILLERYRELPFEGHRYYDLKRNGLTIERSKEDQESGSNQTMLLPSDLYYYLPIPQAEVIANPNIRPNNPGW
jgi:hypothetical protein